MAFFKKDKDELPALTEPSRYRYFRDSDQNEWTRLYQLLTDEIVKMLEANKSLYEIYEFARLERGKIAQQLNHQGKETFGVIREGRGHDFYDVETFAGIESDDPKLFGYVLSAISNESFIDKDTLDEQVADLYYSIRLPPSGTIYQIRSSQKKEFSGEMYLHIVVEKYPDGKEQVIKVNVVWGVMDQEIYKNCINTVDKDLLSKTKISEKGSEEALSNIALLAHALSRDIYVWRGAAAINGAIIRAVAKTKGFDFKLLTVGGLPFDVCAEMISNSHLYAKEFVHDIGQAYKLFIPKKPSP